MKIVKKEVTHNFGYIKIRPTFNNIFITLTDLNGNVLISKHAGMLEFKGSKKRTPYVAAQVLKKLIKDVSLSNFEINYYIVQVHGFIKNAVINSTICQLASFKLKNIIYLENYIKHTHNGLREKKKRRL